MLENGRLARSTHAGYALWVRISHWVLAFSVLTLAVSGFYILMAHPRLYWGEVGNDLTPAWIELPTALYVLIGVVTGHIARDLAPRGVTLRALKTCTPATWRR